MLIRSGEIPSRRQTSIDKTNVCTMKSERGALVRGSDPPSVVRGSDPPSGQCSQNDRWYVAGADGQASDTNTFWRGCVENRRQKISIPLRWQKIDIFSGLGEERRTPRAASRPLAARRRIHLISPRASSTFTGLARHETGWPWVDSMSRSKVYHRVSCFWLYSVLTIFNAKAQVSPREQYLKNTYFEVYIFSPFPP